MASMCEIALRRMLTHLPLDKMTAILADDNFQCISLNENICSLGYSWPYGSIGSDNGLAPNKRQAIIWTNADPIHWRIYGGDELMGLNDDKPALVQVMAWCRQTTSH